MSAIFAVVDRLREALDYHLERHAILASNVANVDTPGFQPLDLVREQSAPTEIGPALQAARTSPAHLGAGDRPENAGVQIVDDRTVVAGADGNAVSLEREMAKIAANDLRYEGAAQIVSRRLALLRYAASDASGG